MRRLALPAAIAAATIAGFVAISLQLSGGALHDAAHPNWPLLATAFVVVALAQPLRAMAWRATLRGGGRLQGRVCRERRRARSSTPCCRRGSARLRRSACSACLGRQPLAGLPARHGQPRLRAPAGGPRVPHGRRRRGSVPAVPRLGALDDGRRLCARRGSDRPGRRSSTASSGECSPDASTASLPMRLPRRASSRTPEASSSRRGSSAGSASCSCCTRSESRSGLGAALVYMIVTGLANTAPILPGNAGVYQGAALGALAMVGEAGSKASRRRARRTALRKRRHSRRRAGRCRALRPPLRGRLARGV